MQIVVFQLQYMDLKGYVSNNCYNAVSKLFNQPESFIKQKLVVNKQMEGKQQHILGGLRLDRTIRPYWSVNSINKQINTKKRNPSIIKIQDLLSKYKYMCTVETKHKLTVTNTK